MSVSLTLVFLLHSGRDPEPMVVSLPERGADDFVLVDRGQSVPGVAGEHERQNGADLGDEVVPTLGPPAGSGRQETTHQVKRVRKHGFSGLLISKSSGKNVFHHFTLARTARLENTKQTTASKYPNLSLVRWNGRCIRELIFCKEKIPRAKHQHVN